MVGITAGAGSPPVKVDKIVRRNPAAGLGIRPWRPPVKRTVPAFAWYIEGRRLASDEL